MLSRQCASGFHASRSLLETRAILSFNAQQTTHMSEAYDILLSEGMSIVEVGDTSYQRDEAYPFLHEVKSASISDACKIIPQGIW